MIDDTVKGLLELPADMSFRLIRSTCKHDRELRKMVNEMHYSFHKNPISATRWDGGTTLPDLLYLELLDNGVIAYKDQKPVAIQLFCVEENRASAFGLYVLQSHRRQRIGSMIRETLYKYLLEQGVLTFDIGGYGSVFKNQAAQGFAQHDMVDYDGAVVRIERTPKRKWIRRYVVNLVDHEPKFDVSRISLA